MLTRSWPTITDDTHAPVTLIIDTWEWHVCTREIIEICRSPETRLCVSIIKNIFQLYAVKFVTRNYKVLHNFNYSSSHLCYYVANLHRPIKDPHLSSCSMQSIASKYEDVILVVTKLTFLINYPTISRLHHTSVIIYSTLHWRRSDLRSKSDDLIAITSLHYTNRSPVIYSVKIKTNNGVSDASMHRDHNDDIKHDNSFIGII